MMKIVKFVLGALIGILLTIYCTIVSVVAFTLFPLSFLLSAGQFLSIYEFAASITWPLFLWYIETWGSTSVTFYGDDLPSGESAYCISNHRGALDWLTLMGLASRKDSLRCVKMVAKDWIKYVPGFGWGSYLIGMVFLKRTWMKDKAAIDQTFSRLRSTGLPFWLISHTEGSRFSASKLKQAHEFAKKRDLPILDEVLLPRHKGFVATVQNLRDLEGIVLLDMTLLYVDGRGSFDGVSSVGTGVVSGRAQNSIHVHVSRFPMSSLPADDEGLQRWLMDRWIQKNRIISEFRKTRSFPDKLCTCCASPTH